MADLPPCPECGARFIHEAGCREAQKRKQTHPQFIGSNTKRQSVGDPGHCEACVTKGHVAAHPDLGCGDVGCTAYHDEDPMLDRCGAAATHEGGIVCTRPEGHPGDEHQAFSRGTLLRWVGDGRRIEEPPAIQKVGQMCGAKSNDLVCLLLKDHDGDHRANNNGHATTWGEFNPTVQPRCPSTFKGVRCDAPRDHPSMHYSPDHTKLWADTEATDPTAQPRCPTWAVYIWGRSRCTKEREHEGEHRYEEIEKLPPTPQSFDNGPREALTALHTAVCDLIPRGGVITPELWSAMALAQKVLDA